MGWGVSLASSGYGPEVLLNILQYTGGSHNKESSDPNVNSAQDENLSSRPVSFLMSNSNKPHSQMRN